MFRLNSKEVKDIYSTQLKVKTTGCVISRPGSHWSRGRVHASFRNNHLAEY